VKYSGVITEIEGELEDGDWIVSEAIVTDTRVCIDWIEGVQSFHAKLESDDGVTFEGHYGTPIPNSNWSMTGVKYTAADGSVLLLLKWDQSDNGIGGWAVLGLEHDE
jgi:hypothetical protein